MSFVDPKAIIDLRHKLGLTQRQAAELVNYSVSAWTQWERGERRMKKEIYLELKKRAGIKTAKKVRKKK